MSSRPTAKEVAKVRQKLQRAVTLRTKQADKHHIVSNDKRSSFAQRIQQVDIDVIHNIEQVFKPEEAPLITHGPLSQSQFREQLMHWSTLNVTQHFDDFLQDVLHYTHTLAQVLFHKQEIVDCIAKHLQVKQTLALEPILTSLVTLAKELRYEFYPHLLHLFNSMVSTINPEDPKSTEIIFQTLAFLFKYLSKYMVADLSKWFATYSQLLEHKKYFIRNFAAESFAFLITKLSEDAIPNLINDIIGLISERPTEEMFDGVSQLFFECMKGSLGSYHSKMPTILATLFRTLDWSLTWSSDLSDQEELLQKRFMLLEKTMNLLMEHTRNKDIAKSLWQMFRSESDTLYSKWIKSGSTHLITQIAHFLGLVKTLIKIKGNIDDEGLFYILNIYTAKEFLHSAQHSSSAVRAIVSLVSTLLIINRTTLSEQIISILRNIFALKSIDALFELFFDLVEKFEESSSRNNHNLLFSTIFNYCTLVMEDSPSYVIAYTLKFIEKLKIHFLHKTSTKYCQFDFDGEIGLVKKMSILMHQKFEELASCSQEKRNQLIGTLITKQESVDDEMDDITAEEQRQGTLSPHIIWGCARALQHFNSSFENPDTIHVFLRDAVEQTFNWISQFQDANKNNLARGDIEVNKAVLTMFGELFKCYLEKVERGSPHLLKNKISLNKFVLDILKGNLFCETSIVLESIYVCLSQIAEKEPKFLNMKLLESVKTSLGKSLASKNSEVRMRALEIITLFEPVSISLNPDSLASPCTILECVRDAERCKLDWEQSRNKTYQIQMAIEQITTYNSKLPELYLFLLNNYATGGSFTKLTLYSTKCKDMALALMQVSSNTEHFWQTYYSTIQSFYPLYLEQLRNKKGSKDLPFSLGREPKKFINVVKFSNYQFLAKSESSISVEKMFMDIVNEEGEYMDLVNWFDNYIWEVFAKTKKFIARYPEDLLQFFYNFFNFEITQFRRIHNVFVLANTKDKRAAKLSSRLLTMLNLINEIPEPFFTQHQEQQTNLTNILFSLICTDHTSIQQTIFKILKKLSISWLEPYLDDIEQILSFKNNQKVLELFDTQVSAGYNRERVMNFVFDCLQPTLLVQVYKESRRSENRTKMRVRSLLEFFTFLSKDEMSQLLSRILAPFVRIEHGGTLILVKVDLSTLPGSEVLRILTVIEQIFSLVGNSVYSAFYPLLLNILLELIDLSDIVLHEKNKNQVVANEEQLIENTASKEEKEYQMEDDLSDMEDKDEKGIDADDNNEGGNKETIIEEFKPETIMDQEEEAKQVIQDLADEFDKQEDEAEKTNEQKTSDVSKFRKQMEKKKCRGYISASISLIRTYLDRHADSAMEKSTLEAIMKLWNKYFDRLEAEPNQPIHNALNILNDFIRQPLLLPLLHVYSNIPNRLLSALSWKFVSLPVFNFVATFFADITKLKDQEMKIPNPTCIDEAISSKMSRNIGKVFLEPFIDKILVSFHHALNTHQHLRRFVERVMVHIIDKLSDYFFDKSPADIILSFYGSIAKDLVELRPEYIDKVISLFSRYLPKASKPTLESYIKLFSKMILKQNNDELKLKIYSIFDEIGKTQMVAMRTVASLLHRLSAYHTSKIGQIDYQTRFAAFEELIATPTILELGDLEILPIVANLLHNIGDELWAIRENTMKTLDAVTKIVAKYNYKDSKTMIMDVLKSGLSSNKMQGGNEYGSLLRSVVFSFKEYRIYKNLETFFELMADLKPESKVTAMNIFAKTNKSFSFPEHSVSELFVPMITNLALNSSNESISNACINNLLDLSSNFSWHYLEPVFKNITRHVTVNENARRKRAIALIHGFVNHISISPSLSNSEQTLRFLEKQVAVSLREKIWSKKENLSVDKINVAKLIVKIFKLCKATRGLNQSITKIIMDVLNKLKTKDQLQRDTSRRAIIDILHELSGVYFHFAITHLKTAFVDGFHVPIMLITILEILRAVSSKYIDVPIDSAVPVLLDILLTRIKNTQKFEEIKDMKEKSLVEDFTHVYASLELLGKMITFEKSINFIIQKIESILQHMHNKEILERCQKMLTRLLQGLYSNSTATEEQLATFILNKLEEKAIYRKQFSAECSSISCYELKKPVVDKESYFLVKQHPGRSGAIDADDYRSKFIAKDDRANDHIIVLFCCNLFNFALTAKRIGSIETISKFIPVFIKYINGKYLDISLAAIKILTTLNGLNLPEIKKHHKDIVNQVFDFMVNTGVESQGNVWDTIFSAVKSFVVDQKVGFSPNRLQTILDMLKVDIAGKNFSDRSIFLVRTLVDKKIMAPQIFDIMNRLRILMLRDLEASLRTSCIETLLSFYLNYPMSEEVLQEHLNFLFKNVINEHLLPSGKLAIIQMIGTIIKKFPLEFIEKKFELVYCPLVMQLVNENINECREHLGEITLTLCKRISDNSFDKVIKLMEKWYKQEKLVILASMVNSIVCGLKKRAKRHLATLLPLAVSHLHSSIGKIKSAGEINSETVDSSGANLVLFQCVTAIKKLYCSNMIPNHYISDLFPTLLQCLVTTLASTRLMTMRIMEVYLANYKPSEDRQSALSKVDNIVQLTLQCIQNIISPNLSDEFVTLMVKCVIGCCKLLLNQHNQEAPNVLPRIFELCKKISEYDPRVKDVEDVMEDEEVIQEKIAALTTQKLTLLKMFVGIAVQLKTQLEPYIGYITPLLFEITETNKWDILAVGDEEGDQLQMGTNVPLVQLKQFAEESKQIIKKQIAYEVFMTAYERGRRDVLTKTEEQGNQVAQKAISNPIEFEQLAQEEIKKRKQKHQKMKELQKVKRERDMDAENEFKKGAKKKKKRKLGSGKL